MSILRDHYLARALSESNESIEKIYERKGSNPKELEIVGTFAPLYADEEIYAMPTGRLMVSNTPNIPTPVGATNNGPRYSLGPAVLKQNGNIISADFSGTFPNYYQNGLNPKYNFGVVSLEVTNGRKTATIAPVDYADTASGDSKGWIFDFDISSNTDALKILKSKNASFRLVQDVLGTVLEETDYYYVTNQLAIYGEQHGSTTQFRNQGTLEPATISVYHRGKELKGNRCPPITLWQYRSIPLEAPGNAKAINTHFKPGQAIEVDTQQPGNFVFTFSINTPNIPTPVGATNNGS